MEYGLGKVEESVELWFSDNQTDHVKVSVKVEKQLFGEQTVPGRRVSGSSWGGMA